MSSAATQAARCRRIVHRALDLVRPHFRLRLDGIHGLAHWSRVCRHGRFLAGELGVDPAITTWFAFLHDACRRHDGCDAGHGRRAADLALRLWRAGNIGELDERGFDRLVEAIRWHSEGGTAGDPAILACWDADRLDLARVGIRPDPRRLATEPARRPAVIEAAVRRALALPRRSVRR